MQVLQVTRGLLVAACAFVGVAIYGSYTEGSRSSLPERARCVVLHVTGKDAPGCDDQPTRAPEVRP